jgi:hypothetical protein
LCSRRIKIKIIITNSQTNKMDTKMADAHSNVEGDIDESLYSRQLYVMGHEAQRKMGNATVLM